jgi:hypothetical protein
MSQSSQHAAPSWYRCSRVEACTSSPAQEAEDDAEEETEVVDNNINNVAAAAPRPSGRVHRPRVVNEKVVDAASRQ